MSYIKTQFKLAIAALMRRLPLKRKLVVSNFLGRRYGDNSKYVVEALHELDDTIEIVWLKDGGYSYSVPEYVRTVERVRGLKRYYEYATAKVWLDTHYPPLDIIRRKDQIFIETWHGGLSIKKVANANKAFKKQNKKNPITEYIVRNASVFVSNSDHINHVYRDEFDYTGPIYKCGYPRSDVLFADNTETRNKVCNYYNIDSNKKILLYVPTFRDFDVNESGAKERYEYLYGIDFDELTKQLKNKFGGDWVVFVRLHPNLIQTELDICSGKNVFDTTQYTDIQDLVVSCDACISDYSSAIFDAAIRNVPCFTFARDFDEYKETRGVEFDLSELPFPYARDNDELMRSVAGFDSDGYKRKWEAFKVRTGLHETGHAAYDVAKKIKDYIDGKPITWE